MRFLFVAIATATFLAHATPLAADERIPVPLGPVIVTLPGAWTDGSPVAQYDDRLIHLAPPLSLLNEVDGVSTDRIEYFSILLQYASDNTHRTIIEFPLADAAERLGIAQPGDAAIAFDGIDFDSLRGGPTAASGKSVTRPLVFVGGVNVGGYGTVVIATRADRSDDGIVRGAYAISAVFEAKGHKFAMTIGLVLSRPLRSGDLALVDFVADTVAAGIAD